MATQSLEERIKLLEKINEEQQHELECAEADREIENVINKYEYYCEAGRWEDVVGLFAKKTPGVRSEIFNWGVYEETEGIKKLYTGLLKQDTYKPDGSGMKPGIFEVNTHTTAVLEIAGDGKTAKGLWVTPGAASIPPTFESFWRWCKLAVDFVKEDGEWKIWHLHVYGIYEASYHKSWAEPGKHPSLEVAPLERHKHGLPPVPDELKPDRPTTHPVWWYTPDAVNDRVPAPPEPYETFDEKTAY